MKKIRIISLGEIVTPNLGKGVAKLAKIIANKTNIDRQLVLPRVAKVTQAQPQMNAIEKFKQGSLTEVEFDALMVQAYCDEFQTELSGGAFTADDFNTAWNAMNPDYDLFAGALASAAVFNKQKDCKLIFISYTNPKDMRHLQSQLHEHGIPCEFDHGQQLRSINGITLHTTYVKNCNKADLITAVVNDLMVAKGPGLFAGNEGKVDIKYIHGVNGLESMEAMSKEFDATDVAVQEAMKALRVDSILWNKADKDIKLFNLLLDNKEPVHGLL
jgi:hypothetical protein